MPNNTRIPICPFFRDEKNKSISCEDIFRGFNSVKQKYDWMDTYCDSWEWSRCPYAVSLNEMYERIEKGADMELEQLEHKVEALTKELRSQAKKLGRAYRRIEAKDEEIKELRKKNTILQEQKQNEFSKRRRAEYELDKHGRKVSDQLQEVINLYKDAFCYLLDKCPNKRIPEADIKAWAEGKNFTVVRMFDDAGQMNWFLDVYEETKEDGSNECERVPADDTESGTGEQVS